MQLVSFAITHYVSIQYERFTDKIIAALAIFQVIQKKEDNTEMEEDEMEVRWIEENSHPDVMVPIYILDRYINPIKREFNIARNRITFDTNLKDEHDKELSKQITLTENQIQYYLCKSIRRVNDIVMKNIKVYCDEIPLPDLGAIATDDKTSFEDV